MSTYGRIPALNRSYNESSTRGSTIFSPAFFFFFFLLILRRSWISLTSKEHESYLALIFTDHTPFFLNQPK